jgi:hypothetical protein
MHAHEDTHTHAHLGGARQACEVGITQSLSCCGPVHWVKRNESLQQREGTFVGIWKFLLQRYGGLVGHGSEERPCLSVFVYVHSNVHVGQWKKKNLGACNCLRGLESSIEEIRTLYLNIVHIVQQQRPGNHKHAQMSKALDFLLARII